MKRAVFLLMISIVVGAQSPKKKPPDTLRGVLLEELRTTRNQEDWFVPASIAVQGLTAEQAKWKPGPNGHSIGELAYHLWFWNTQEIARLQSSKPSAYSGNNDETFTQFDPAQWNALVTKLDQVLSDWEKAVTAADDQKLAANASLIGHVATHNAYHIGQILYVRKLHGAWDSSKGVK